MAMTRFEKIFVNRERKGERNIEKVRTLLEQLGVENLNDALELGCGIGSVSAFLSENYGMSVVGTDFDPEQVQNARSNYPDNEWLQFKVEDGSNLSFEDGSFDLVVSQNVFHHIQAWAVAVHEVSRVLRRGGYFIWLDLVFPGLIKTLFQPLVKNYGLYTLDDIENAFAQGGFKQQYHERLAHAPFTVYQIVLQKIDT